MARRAKLDTDRENCPQDILDMTLEELQKAHELSAANNPERKEKWEALLATRDAAQAAVHAFHLRERQILSELVRKMEERKQKEEGAA